MDESTNNDALNKSDNNPEKYNLINYKFNQTLGSGTFGKVKSAIHIPSGQNVAIKIIDKKTLKDDDDRHRVERQVEIMKAMRHPNIIQFYQKIQTANQIFLIVQYAQNGQLFKLMSEEVRLNQRAAGRIFIQLMNAVQYLHRLGIAHRDLKPQNILLDVDYNIKLIDFGLSNYTQKGQFLHTACGSPCYAPPEMVSGNSYEGQIGDVWSMGIIFYGMICGSLPFEQNTTKQLYKKVIQGFYVIPSDISLQATQVIRRMLVTDPKKRITIPQLRKLKFFRSLREVEPKLIGIIVGFHPMPIDNEIIETMSKIMQFERDKVEDQIKQNLHSKYTTLYYLLQKQSLRKGGKTVVDLQYFLESSERYKSQYGVLPQQCNQQLSIVEGRQQSSQSIRTIKNIKPNSKYNINNTKGLSKQKRQPILIKKKGTSQNIGNSVYRSSQKSDRQEKPEQLLTSVRKYKIQKSHKLQKKLQKTLQKTLQIKQQKSIASSQRPYRYKTMASQQKSKQKISTHKSRQPSNKSSSNSKKKSTKKIKIGNNNNLAINLWNAYFEKTLEPNKINKGPNSGRGNKLLKQKQKQADRTFNNNIQKLKEGFLKLPHMKKGKDQQKQKIKKQNNFTPNPQNQQIKP